MKIIHFQNIATMLKKSLFVLLILSTAMGSLYAQQDKSKRPSPPAKMETAIGDLKVVIEYNSPAVKGRTIWGELVPYGKIWRTGANEATTFTISHDAMVQGHHLAAGKYALFTIPGEEEWVIVFNKVADQWGAYNYNEKEDALRVAAKAGSAPEFNERLTFEAAVRDTVGFVNIKWENLAVGFSIKKAE